MPSPRALAALALACGACAIDPGPQPDGGACDPDPDYFVSDVYPRYLVAGRCSADRGCHGGGDAHGTLRIRPPEAAPAPGTPLAAWPPNWRDNYFDAAALVRCDQPGQSHLLLVPEGLADLHPPGPVVGDRAAAATLIETWVARAH